MSLAPHGLPRLRPGTAVGGYELLWLLAESGSSTLYLVRPWRTRDPFRTLRRWALKARLALLGATIDLARERQLGVLKIARPDFQPNLHDEHEYLSRTQFSHPHLVQMYSRRFDVSTRRRPRDLAFVALPAGREPLSCPYIVLAYEPGLPLDELLRRRRFRPLAGPAAVAIVLQVAAALDHLHRQGLIHHDVKPANIILRQSGPLWRAAPPDVVLLDLGAAERIDNPHQRHIYGTKLYLPPERLRESDAGAADVQVDIYGLGRTAYELLAGSLETETTVELRDSRRRPPPVRRFNPAVSPALEAVVDDATHRDGAHRRQVLPDLDALIRRLEATPEAGRPARLQAPFVSSLAVGLVALLATTALILAASFLLVGPLRVAGEPEIQPTVTPLLVATPALTATATPSPAPASPTVGPTSTRVPTGVASSPKPAP